MFFQVFRFFARATLCPGANREFCAGAGNYLVCAASGPKILEKEAKMNIECFALAGWPQSDCY